MMKLSDHEGTLAIHGINHVDDLAILSFQKGWRSLAWDEAFVVPRKTLLHIKVNDAIIHESWRLFDL